MQTPCHSGHTSTACETSGSERVLVGWTCRRTSWSTADNETDALRCVCGHGPGVAMVARTVYHSVDMHSLVCASSRACCTPGLRYIPVADKVNENKVLRDPLGGTAI